MLLDETVDVRGLRRPDQHPTIFAAYRSLRIGESLVLVTDHDPQQLSEEFEADHADSYAWEYLQRESGEWRIRITKLTSTPLPRLLATTSTGADAPAEGGAVWQLSAHQRDLDSAVISMPPNTTVERHVGPDLDVLIHVTGGFGELVTERGRVALAPGDLVWLPRRSQRKFAAGPDGLSYLTVSRRRPDALTVSPVERR